MTRTAGRLTVTIDAPGLAAIALCANKAADGLRELFVSMRRNGKSLISAQIFEYMMTPPVIRRRKHRALMRSRRNTAYKSRKHGRQVRTRCKTTRSTPPSAYRSR